MQHLMKLLCRTQNTSFYVHMSPKEMTDRTVLLGLGERHLHSPRYLSAEDDLQVLILQRSSANSHADLVTVQG